LGFLFIYTIENAFKPRLDVSSGGKKNPAPLVEVKKGIHKQLIPTIGDQPTIFLAAIPSC
jgi:hypothetical protein